MTNQQLRKHLKPNFFTWWRYQKNKWRLKKVGKNVFFEVNSKIFRYPKNVEIEDNCVIKEGARICACNGSASIYIGQNTTIGYHTFIFASERIEIANDCLIAPFVYIVDSDHGIEKNIPINQQANETAAIKIEEDVWIGTGAKILKGVTIKKGSIIAAGSVVNADTVEFGIYGGTPAKKIGERP